MLCGEIRLTDYRNLTDVALTFSPGLNVLWGLNAQGKSNILEGVYFFARESRSGALMTVSCAGSDAIRPFCKCTAAATRIFMTRFWKRISPPPAAAG